VFFFFEQMNNELADLLTPSESHNRRLNKNNAQMNNIGQRSSGIEARSIRWRIELAEQAKFVLTRLPSIVIADTLLLNSEYIQAEISKRIGHLVYGFFVFLATKLTLFFGLFVCLLLFTLKIKYVITLYKTIALFSMPFFFSHSIQYVNSNAINFGQYTLPKGLLICIIYSFTFKMTVLLYNEFYLNCIRDRHKMHERYQLNRNRSMQSVNDYLDVLLDYESENYKMDNNKEEEMKDLHFYLHRRWSTLKKRRLFILFYSILSFVLNETGLVIYQETVNKVNDTFMEAHRQFNVITLGFLILLTYDLGVNLDQMLLRFIIQLRILCRLISQYGLNNLLSFNWFQRLRVPYLLRIYFAFKCIMFTISFLLYKDYYLELDEIIKNQTSSESFSLIGVISSLLSDYSSKNQNISTLDAEASGNGNNIMATETVWNYFTSYFDYIHFGAVHNHKQHVIAHSSETLEKNASTATTAHSHLPLPYAVNVYSKMLVLSLSETIISISSITSILSWQFYLIGKFVNKLTDPPNVTTINNRAQIDGPRTAPLQAQAQPQQRVNLLNEPLAARAEAVRPANNQNNVENDIDLLNVGDVAAILFFLLSIQSGLSSLSGYQRIEKFFKNYSLLFIAILHYFHTNLDQQLMTLSASSKPNWLNEKHIRVLCVSFSLIVLPLLILIFLWTQFSLSTWLLAASAFNIELIVKMSVSIILYMLFLIDSKRIANSYEKLVKLNEGRSNSAVEEQLSDNLDDYIYYVKAFGHTMEFLVALFLFFNGAYILFFESCGTIRAFMMCIHAYFHIWRQARMGWSVFIKRRTAIGKLKRLAVFNRKNYASMKQKQLSSRLESAAANEIFIQHRDYKNDEAYDQEYDKLQSEVCAICFCELSAYEARLTNCNHIYHTICLRKWIYLQDTCPMCHQIVYATSQGSSTNT
jgi:hypothetical protein